MSGALFDDIGLLGTERAGDEVLAAGPDVGEHHEAEAALAVTGERQAVDGVGCGAELAHCGCVRGDLSKGRGRTGDVAPL